jgi:hypothetical protein
VQDRPLRYLSSLPLTPQDFCVADLPTTLPKRLDRLFQLPAGLPPCVPTSLKRYRGGIGISTDYPSPTPFGLGLGPDLP